MLKVPQIQAININFHFPYIYKEARRLYPLLAPHIEAVGIALAFETSNP